MTINSLSDVNVSLADETLMHVMTECPEALDEWDIIELVFDDATIEVV